MKVLIDGDIIRYRVGFACQHTYYDWWHQDDIEKDEELGGGMVVKASAKEPVAECIDAKAAKEWIEAAENPELYVRIPRVEVEPLGNALSACNLVMDSIIKRYQPCDVVVYFSCPTEDNWRTAFYPEYKATRPSRKPHWHAEVQDHMAKKWGCILAPSLEADDLIAMAAATCADEEEDACVVTIDKDMDQIPGLHYNWVKDEEYFMTEAEAEFCLQVQCLAGDRTDNIKGIPGMGEVKATKWLQEESKVNGYVRVWDAYKAYYDDPYEADYQVALNRALVTLPVDDAHRVDLITEIEDARREMQKAA